MEYEAFVYKWTDSSNGKMYIGSHKGSIRDGYVGSGKIFKRAYKKRPEYFKREILYTGSYESVIELEEFILSELDAANSNEYYNLKNAATGGTTASGEKHYLFRKTGSLHPRYGSSHTKETKAIMSNKGRGFLKSEIAKAANINSKKVYCGELNLTFKSLTECSNTLKENGFSGCDTGNLSSMALGKRNNKYGIKYID